MIQNQQSKLVFSFLIIQLLGYNNYKLFFIICQQNITYFQNQQALISLLIKINNQICSFRKSQSLKNYYQTFQKQFISQLYLFINILIVKIKSFYKNAYFIYRTKRGIQLEDIQAMRSKQIVENRLRKLTIIAYSKLIKQQFYIYYFFYQISIYLYLFQKSKLFIYLFNKLKQSSKQQNLYVKRDRNNFYKFY
ncbi:transmembrane protein, putative (macronuclear) [Tetrahymena thermophila SB210]|uniref:Transmembrane protein, putative n=1 Tax=Tetrahymena thermophila (strain SB210) TaxID=312017 RepID=W7XAJ2_TETTS|nr:transmembrane protein, putative [Tetrahymena thermophila SB210]EWS76400.1 transmembrane protein, putative [Tetrahymena thermophila SB210]|eukprot:XP_012651184.1 transmembrane protein, putative [Tetrahymena thermophila SB210]